MIHSKLPALSESGTRVRVHSVLPIPPGIALAGAFSILVAILTLSCTTPGHFPESGPVPVYRFSVASSPEPVTGKGVLARVSNMHLPGHRDFTFSLLSTTDSELTNPAAESGRNPEPGLSETGNIKDSRKPPPAPELSPSDSTTSAIPLQVADVRVSRNSWNPDFPPVPSWVKVYPVKVSWQGISSATGYSLWRSTSPYTGYTLLKDNIPHVPDEQDRIVFYDTFWKKTGVYYFYRVRANNEQGPFGLFSTPQSGYGALSNKQLLTEFQLTVVNAHQKLTYIHRKGLGALGEESRDGTLSGTVHYKTTASLKGGVGTVQYTDYADVPDPLQPENSLLTINGQNITKVRLNANGHQKGTYTITGMYGTPATSIRADLVITSGKATDGTFSIEQGNGIPPGTVLNNVLPQP